MMTQTDLFAPHDEITAPLDAEHEAAPVRSASKQIAVPCGFRDRHNNPCQRRGNWPIMDGAKQMLCRDRPMVHCDTACFRGDPPAPAHEAGDEDVLWGDQEGDYGDDQ
jgi:hypothetical protein